MILSLTSIPPRFHRLAAQISALLPQMRPSDRLLLAIPHSYHRFPNWDGSLPDLPAGTELLRPSDLGPATKFATAYGAHPSEDVLIADDDCQYAPGWVQAFRDARGRHPTAAIAGATFDTRRLGRARGHRIVQGFAGVLLRPAWLFQDVLSPPEPARWVDDIWLSAYLAQARVPIIDCPQARAHVVPEDMPAPLQDARIKGASRAQLNRDVASSLAESLDIWGGSGGESGACV